MNYMPILQLSYYTHIYILVKLETNHNGCNLDIQDLYDNTVQHRTYPVWSSG